MNPPYYIQRCLFRDGKLVYDYMGSAEFEFGDQAKSLKRMFDKGLVTGMTTIVVEGEPVPVYMIAADKRLFTQYQPHLQQLAQDKVRLKERSGFDTAVMNVLGLPIPSWSDFYKADAWFDFPNEVLWALSEENRQTLMTALKDIKKKWALKAKEKQ